MTMEHKEHGRSRSTRTVMIRLFGIAAIILLANSSTTVVDCASCGPEEMACVDDELDCADMFAGQDCTEYMETNNPTCTNCGQKYSLTCWGNCTIQNPSPPPATLDGTILRCEEDVI
jgi:hypothetical protein